ncbi:MAG: amidohydrolase family protein [Thermonemataceae bacterium]
MMQRRKALKKILQWSVVASIAPHITVGKSRSLKIGIQNGKVFSGGKLQEGFVGITQDNTLQFSEVSLPAERTLEAKGQWVCAGFIDILGDNSSYPEKTYRIFEKYKLADGVTTVLQMHGGSGNPAYFYNYFKSKPHYTNYGVSTKVMVIRMQYNTVGSRKRAIEQALEAGALGVSHSLEYQPTPYQEVVAYAYLAKQYDRPLFLHLRYSSKEKELEGVKEAIQIAKDTDVRLHIDHLHSTGGTFHMEEALTLIQAAREEGVSITTCIYPYTYWATYLHSRRFAEGWQQRYQLDYSDLTVVGTGEKLTKGRFYQLRKQMGILVAVPEGTMPFEKTIDLALQTDFCMIGSDGGIERTPRANSHPRGAGCFATAIQHGLQIGLSNEKLLAKVITLPAQLIGKPLAQRGDIQQGYIADLVIFDPKQIQGKATVANPNQFSAGITWVIVNGEIAYHQNELKASRGQAILY